MKNHLAVVLFLGHTCSSQPLPARSLHPYGRYLLTDSRHIELISSGVHFGFSFTGNECALFAYIADAAGHNYLQYVLDGKHKRLPFDSAVFVNRYIQYVRLVKSKYPTARIVLLSSGMIKGPQRTQLQNCLTAVEAGIDALYPADRPVAFYFFKLMQARGCDGHPNVEDHGILAKELEPFLKDCYKASTGIQLPKYPYQFFMIF